MKLSIRQLTRSHLPVIIALAFLATGNYPAFFRYLEVLL